MTKSIALSGRTGSGKTLIAEYLASHYGYQHRLTGSVCRDVCRLLYESEAKTLLNKVTDALKAIDEDIWIRAALRATGPDTLIVLDSIRFDNDYRYVRSKDFSIWRVDAPLDIRVRRLQGRNQEYDPEVDEYHRGETELEPYTFDYRIVNADIDIPTLYRMVDETLSLMRSA
jgi:cytidylate kinase